jgi:hypothetical protein
MWRCAWLCVVAVGLLAPCTAAGRDYVVDGQNARAADSNPGTAEQPFKTVGKAAQVVRPGDTVIVRPGVYRESVKLRQSGTPAAPITFTADPPGSVVVTGADIMTGWEKVPGEAPIYRIAWPHVFMVGRSKDGKPVEHHPADAPLWGRAEQVIAHGRQLLPVEGLAELKKAWLAEYLTARGAVQSELPPTVPPPLPNLGGPFAGLFAVDTAKKELYVLLADCSDPNRRKMVAATRGQVFGVNPWENKAGVEYIHVRNFIFRYGATFPQRAAVWLHGRHNLLENSVVEEMAGSGAHVSGTMRRCIIRRCGQTGGGASEDGFLNEECLWEGNCWKPIDRGWDAGGFKMCRVKGGVFRRCLFLRNGGQGLWFDIDVRDVLVTECIFQENEGSGLFIEISRDIRAAGNLAVRNAVGAVGRASSHDWSSAGIQIAESQNCIVAFNTCVGNKDGIAFREQGPRTLTTDDFGEWPYHDAGNVVFGNVCASNRGYQLGLWYDNAFFGWHPSEKEKFKTEEAYAEHLKTIPDRIYDPTKQGMVIDRNLYLGEAGKPVILYGCPWRPKHETFGDPAAFAARTGFDAGSRAADPQFVNPSAGDWRPKKDGPAWAMQVGWLTPPPSVDAWMAEFLPSFIK